MRDAFELADVFIAHDGTQQAQPEVERFFRLVFGKPVELPTQDELAMFLAYAASTRSADLSHQVGAVLWKERLGVVATGCNDVPQAGGGLYQVGDGDRRDYVQGGDANEAQKEAIASEIAARVAAVLRKANKRAAAPAPRANAPLCPSDYLTRILNARVYDVAVESALEPARNLSRRLHNKVLLKREDQQPVFSFKLRGAYNKMAHLTPEQLRKGGICASAGNHAQGVALGAHKLGTRAVIVMPTTTPRVKVDAVRSFGGEVVLHGDSYSDAYGHAVRLQKKEALTFVHPFDDPDVIAGQGTIAMEILRQLQSLGSDHLDRCSLPLAAEV